MAIFRQAGVTPTVVHDTARLHTMLSLVATGRGVSLTGKSVERLGVAGVVCRPVRPVARIEMGLAYNPDNRSTLLRALIAVVDEIFAPTP